MYDFLLFVHVLSVFVLMAPVVIYTGFAVGVPATPSTLRTTEILWGIGTAGTLVFGVWLALNVDGYELWDGWILGAILLWAAAAETGRRAFAATKAGDTQAMVPWHVARAAIVLALLVVMIYKPGA
jgi:hypothetical protein